MLSKNKQAAKQGRVRKGHSSAGACGGMEVFSSILGSRWGWDSQIHKAVAGSLLSCGFSKAPSPSQLILCGPRGPASCIPAPEPDSPWLWNLDGSFSSWLPCKQPVCRQRVSH